MKLEFFIFISVLTTIILIVDIYVWSGLLLLIKKKIKRQKIRKIIHVFYWGFSILIVIALAILLIYYPKSYVPWKYMYFQYLSGIILISIVTKLVFITFHFTNDTIYCVYWLKQKFFKPKIEKMQGERIPRRVFITQAGLFAASIPLASLTYGMVKGKYDFRVIREKMLFPNLPKAFDGLRIVQISDMHLGSFFHDYKSVLKGLDLINEQKPDIIFCTGDWVNNYAAEMEGWQETLLKMKARIGKYAVLCNHDYADYMQWESEEAKAKNLEQLKKIIKESNFKLLLNQTELLQSDGEKIAIIGVENWGANNWTSKYGDLRKAIDGSQNTSFKILLSHDPSHWDAQVLGKTDIDLTFSGHTHGMQFGVQIGNKEWSPVENLYRRWGGTYKEDKQYLYVNRGFGFIGFPGRVGMPPEITFVELKKS